MRSFVASAAVLATSVVANNPNDNIYTATATSDVYAAQATAKTLSPTSHVKGKAFDRFVTIWMENTDFDMAAADPNLSWLASKGIILSQYHSVTHPSQPNYIASISGDHFGMQNDDFTQIPSNVSTVIDLLEDKGISWGAYQEDMPYSGFEGNAWVNTETGANDYVRKHNPPVNFNSVADSRERLAVIKNTTQFHEDLAANALPQWMFITPNMTSDGHDTDVTVAGAWTRNFLEPLLDDKNFMQNTLVLVTFDESETYSVKNNIFSILLGDAVPEELVGTTDNNYYNHYSDISTVEANWGLHTLGRFDVGANVFDLVGKKTGDAIRPWDGAVPFDSIFFNSSYAGAYNTFGGNQRIPSPNLGACSRTKRTVLPKIKATWANSTAPVYYTNRVATPDGQHPPAGYTPVDFLD